MIIDPIGEMVHNALTEAITGVPIEELERLEELSMEEKIILASEEEYSQNRELTPGEISLIVNNVLRYLPEDFPEGNEEEVITEYCYNVAYEVMRQLNEG